MPKPQVYAYPANLKHDIRAAIALGVGIPLPALTSCEADVNEIFQVGMQAITCVLRSLL